MKVSSHHLLVNCVCSGVSRLRYQVELEILHNPAQELSQTFLLYRFGNHQSFENFLLMEVVLCQILSGGSTSYSGGAGGSGYGGNDQNAEANKGYSSRYADEQDSNRSGRSARSARREKARGGYSAPSVVQDELLISCVF